MDTRVMARLFETNFHGAWQANIAKAISLVEGLPRSVVRDPGLQGRLDKIVASQSLQVAELDPTGIHAVRFEQSGRREDRWGEERQFRRAMLKVHIPFSGEAQSFRLSPSSSHMIYAEVEVGGNELLLTISDDDNAQREVDSFVKLVQENLQGLKREYDQHLPQLSKAVSEAAERVRAKFDAEDSRAAKLNFPVR